MTNTYSLSPHNQKVFDLLRHSLKPLSAYDILDKLRSEGLRAPTTVYRALDVLTKRGLVHRIETTNTFIACRHGGDNGHNGQFAVCSYCGMAQELDLQSVAAVLHKAGRKFLAEVEHSVIEMTGTCHLCSKKKQD